MSQLNGAYYGPSVPPPPPTKYHRRQSHGGGCGCLGSCLSCCCGCIFNCILGIICKILLTIVIIAIIVGFLFWLIVRPNVLKYHVTDASLTQFSYTNNTLHYNLALNITIRNPNRRLGVYYDYIESTAWYDDIRFGFQTLGPFFQHHKNTSVLSPVFKGQQVMLLGSDRVLDLNKEKSSGIYNVDVKLLMKIRFKLGLFKTGKATAKIRCDLKIPEKSHNGTSNSGGFETTACDYYGFKF